MLRVTGKQVGIPRERGAELRVAISCDAEIRSVNAGDADAEFRLQLPVDRRVVLHGMCFDNGDIGHSSTSSSNATSSPTLIVPPFTTIANAPPPQSIYMD